MFMHRNWRKTGLLDKMAEQAGKRSLKDLTVGPVLTWNNEMIKAHLDAILELDGSKILFGGVPLTGHSIPKQYGSWTPTAVFVPLKHFRGKKARKLLSTELFGPFQVVTEYGNADIDKVLDIMESLPHHLTAAIVSNDAQFQDKFLGNTVNGTTYMGWRGRTTGAP